MFASEIARVCNILKTMCLKSYYRNWAKFAGPKAVLWSPPHVVSWQVMLQHRCETGWWSQGGLKHLFVVSLM